LTLPLPYRTGTVARKAGGSGAKQFILGVMAVLTPLAHVGHWLWALYLPPVLIVVGSLARTTFVERRKKREED